jgi:hypothetical protein
MFSIRIIEDARLASIRQKFLSGLSRKEILFDLV